MAKADEDGDAFNAAVAAQLKARREYTGKTYPEITAETGLSKALLITMLLNRREMKLADFYKVAESLGLDAAEVTVEAHRRVRENLPNG